MSKRGRFRFFGLDLGKTNLVFEKRKKEGLFLQILVNYDYVVFYYVKNCQICHLCSMFCGSELLIYDLLKKG